MFQLPTEIPLKFTNSLGPWREIFSPNDGSLLTKVQLAREEDILSLLSETKKVQKTISALKPYERSKILKDVAAQVQRDEEMLAFLISSEGGKPLKDAKIEVKRAQITLELCAEEALRLQGEVIPMERTSFGTDHFAFTMREPIGAVLAISAFNHPLNLIAHQVGCAIGSGCSVVLKPAPATPLAANYLREAFLKASLPETGIRVVMADILLIEKLVSSPEFDFVSFIGSQKVGWELRKKLAHGTRMSLELGGVAPAIVAQDANLNSAAIALVKGAFYHAGQACISTQRIYVHKKVFDQFLNSFKTLTENLITGKATHETTDIGPLIRPEEVIRIQKWVQEALSLGGNLVTGNRVFGERHQFLTPTILTHVPEECTIMKEEVFGPVVCVNSYEDEEKLLNHLNNSDFIFESALFTTDVNRAFKMARDISTMTFVINNHTAFRVDQMPFGGHKKSGLGMGGVKYSMEEMTRLKQIILKTNA
jgi:acyl-CoA reductase-like NAD-dependent aldehyde dehydrogenase